MPALHIVAAAQPPGQGRPARAALLREVASGALILFAAGAAPICLFELGRRDIFGALRRRRLQGKPIAEVPAITTVPVPGAPDAGDGLEVLRAEVAAHAPQGREAKLQAVLKELVEKEASALRRFQKARKKGDHDEMDSAQSMWQYYSKDLQLLRSDPDEFVKQRGWFFGIKT